MNFKEFEKRLTEAHLQIVSEPTPRKVMLPKNFTHLTEEDSLLTPLPAEGFEKSDTISNILRGHEEFTLDIHGKIISSNLEAVNVTGYEEWEAIGRHFSIFYSEDDKAAGKPAKDLEKAKDVSKIIFSAWRVKKRNVKFWAHVVISCLKDHDGFVMGYKMIHKDQTYKLISKDRVKRFRNEYLNVFNNPFIGIFKFKLSDFKMTLTNEKATHIIGIEREDKKFNEIFKNSEDFELFASILKKHQHIQGFEFQIKNKWIERWVRVDCKVFESEGFAEGIISDVTESKKQLLELHRLNNELDSFIYRASHDLRAPLTSLLGLINLAEKDKQISIEEYCRMMKDRVIHLDDLLRDMTLIVLNSKEEVKFESVDFKNITSRIVESHKTNANLNISTHVADPSTFLGDRFRIEMILNNLVNYAIRHKNPAAGLSEMNIAINIVDDHAIICFKENGIGIKEDQLPKVFGMFYKVSEDVRDGGLGLYITKLIVDKLQGRITIKSKHGYGTEFTILIPTARPTIL